MIGAMLGKVLDVDIEVDDTGWGRHLQIKVEINLSKTLSRGRSNIIRGEKLWIAVKYEKIMQFHFACGKILHTYNCRLVEGDDTKEQFKSWLRANCRKKGGFSFSKIVKPFSHSEMTIPPKRSSKNDKQGKVH